MPDNATVTRAQLIDKLNEDLSREYQAIIAYVVYSQVLKGAEYMNIAKELEAHAGEELSHALIISKHVDYLGSMPSPRTFGKSCGRNRSTSSIWRPRSARMRLICRKSSWR